jgi:hypothetical protein
MSALMDQLLQQQQQQQQQQGASSSQASLTCVDDAIMRLGEERAQLQHTAAEQVSTGT